jgi:NAD(P)H-dependent FMN reductase
MTDVAIITGSTRPGRKGDAVASWVRDLAVKRGDARYEAVDLADLAPPSLDEPMPAIMGQYTQPHTHTWAAKIASFDAYVFVTPEYNHSAPGPLKNAIDFLYAEWTNKAVGFVGYRAAGGARAIEHLRLVLSCLQVALKGLREGERHAA